VEWILFAGVMVAGAGYLRGRRRHTTQRRLDEADLSLLRQTLDEDVIALGEDLHQFDVDLVGEELDAGSRLEFSRASSSRWSLSARRR